MSTWKSAILVLFINLISTTLFAKQFLDINLKRNDDSSVQVSMSFKGDDSGSSQLVLNPWGGIDNLSSHLISLKAEGAKSGVLKLELMDKDGQWQIKHLPEELISVSYLLSSNDHHLADSSQGYYRPIVNEQLFHAVGHNFLALPEHYTNAIELSFNWQEFEEQTMTSLGNINSKFRMTTDRSAIYESLYVAGPLHVEKVVIENKPLYVSLHGSDWQFKFEELVQLVAKVTRAERDYFDDHDFDFYWVNAIAVGAPLEQGYNFGGTRLHDSFALFFNPSTLFEYDLPEVSPIVHLLAHEMMHTWIGGKLRPETDSTEGTYYWFTEGMTNYLTSQVLLEQGLITASQFQHALNKVFRDYYGNAEQSIENSAIPDRFWTSSDVQKIPYLRGELIATYLEQQFKGKVKIKNIISDWLQSDLAIGFDYGHFMKRLKPHVSPETLVQLDRFIQTGKLSEWDSQLLLSGLCMNLKPVSIYKWESGFDHNKSFGDRIIKDVQINSNAYRAGLRDGQKILSGSMVFGDTSKAVELQVEGKDEPIRYMPLGEESKVPQVQPGQTSC